MTLRAGDLPPRTTPTGTPYRVAVVCLGNICRSPMADVVVNDRLETAGLDDRVEVVSAGTGGWHVGGPMDRRAAALTDGTRSVELYQIVGNPHHDGIIMAYLRKEKLLIEADVYTPLAPGAEPPKVPNPQAVNLESNVRRLGLEVDRIVSIHGRIVPYSELLAAIGKKPAPAKQE